MVHNTWQLHKTKVAATILLNGDSDTMV